MFADIAHGNNDLADAMFLVSIIILAVSALCFALKATRNTVIPHILLAAGLAVLAFAWLQL